MTSDTFPSLGPNEDENELLRTMREQANEQIAETHKEIVETRERIGQSMFELERIMCDKFRDLREERGWSQVEVSERLAYLGFEMHQTTVAKMEKGKRPLRVAEMFALSQVFGLPPGAVFYMPRKGLTFELEYMTDRLESLDHVLNDTREMFFKNMEAHLDHQAELTFQRLELVKAMRQAGVEVDSGEHPKEG